MRKQETKRGTEKEGKPINSFCCFFLDIYTYRLKERHEIQNPERNKWHQVLSTEAQK